jgi:hypothetical protein
VEWAKNTLQTILSEYREIEGFWDPTNSFYKPHSQKSNAWEETGQLLGCEAAGDKKNGFAVVIVRV